MVWAFGMDPERLKPSLFLCQTPSEGLKGEAGWFWRIRSLERSGALYAHEALHSDGFVVVPKRGSDDAVTRSGSVAFSFKSERQRST